jgi:chromosome segregation ATPase
MKAKLKDFDELKEKVIVLEDQLRASEESNREFRNNLQHYERLNGQLRADMQSLNDLYNSEHSEFEATQQANSRLEQELVRIQQEMIFFQKESQKNLELRKQSQSLTTQVAQLQGQIDEERAAAAKTLMESGRRVQEVEEEKAKLSAHFWSLKEECNSYKSSLQEFRDRENVLQKKLLDLQSSSSQFKDRALMYMEDQRAAEVRGKSNNAHRTNEIAMLRGEVASLQNALAARESDLQSITNKLQSSNTEKSDLKLKHTEMSEVSVSFQIS